MRAGKISDRLGPQYNFDHEGFERGEVDVYRKIRTVLLMLKEWS
jgi:hypothetical protein